MHPSLSESSVRSHFAHKPISDGIPMERGRSLVREYIWEFLVLRAVTNCRVFDGSLNPEDLNITTLMSPASMSHPERYRDARLG